MAKGREDVVDGGITLFTSKKRSRVTVDDQASNKKQKPAANLRSSTPTSPNPETSDTNNEPNQNPVVEGLDSTCEVALVPKKLREGVFPEEDVSFRDLGLSEWLSTTCVGLGMSRPTDIQCGCVPAVLSGKNVIGVAQTGSGKTAAFALPILQILGRDPYGVFTLVVTPTRELAFQLAEQFKALGAGMSLRVCVVVGGLDLHAQTLQVARRPHIVVATPGRLASMFDNDGQIAGVFSRAQFLVLDEADRLLDPGYDTALRTILEPLPTGRQTLLFSATMTKSLIKLQKAVLKDAYVYQTHPGPKTPSTLCQEYIFIPERVRDVYLFHLLKDLEDLGIRSTIIFCSTCDACKLLKYVLDELGFECCAIHAQLMQKQRLSSLERFKSGRVPMLVATDVASRGLDIPIVDLVVNYELPSAARDYVHRVGRTARAGRRGRAVSFVTQYDIDLVHKIEEMIGIELKEYGMDEEAVLKGMTKVYTARKAASMKLTREEVYEKKKGTKERKKSGRRGL